MDQSQGFYPQAEAFNKAWLLRPLQRFSYLWPLPWSEFRRIFQHKLIINLTSGSNINMPHLRRSWLHSKSASVLEKYFRLD